MLKKHLAVFLAILAFFSLSLLAQEINEYKTEERISMVTYKEAGILARNEAVNKLRRGMGPAEVTKVMGRPGWSVTGRYLPMYFFYSGAITLDFDPGPGLSYVTNGNGLDLLSTEFMAEVTDFIVLINDEIISTSNPVLFIADNTYVPLVDIVKQLGMEVSCSANVPIENPTILKDDISLVKEAVGKLRKGMTEDEVIKLLGEPWSKYANYQMYLFGFWGTLNLQYEEGKLISALHNYVLDLFSVELAVVKVVDFPIFVDGEGLLAFDPIVALDDVIYVSTMDIGKKIKGVHLNEEKHTLEITTKANDEEYMAKVFDATILIDGEKSFTLNPIVTIGGKIYLPIEELEEEFQIKVIQNAEYQPYEINGKVRGTFRVITALEIATEIKDGFTIKDKAAIAALKEDVNKIHRGMAGDEVKQVLGKTEIPGISVPSLYQYYDYTHKNDADLGLSYIDGKLFAAFNPNGFDLLSTAYIAETMSVPLLIDKDEILISMPIVMIHYAIYLPIEELAEHLGLEVNFSDEGGLEITTKFQKVANLE